jgi:hypothetical protein
MRLWIGIATFLTGVALWYRSMRIPGRGPPWLGRLGLGTSALGVSTLAMTQQGISWIVSSICFSLVAIVLLVSVIAETFRR